MIKNENQENRDWLIHQISFWEHRCDFADRKGWDDIYSKMYKILKFYKKEFKNFKPKKINIPIQMVVNIEKLKEEVANYNPYVIVKKSVVERNN